MRKIVSLCLVMCIGWSGLTLLIACDNSDGKIVQSGASNAGEMASNQMDLCLQIERSLSANEIDKAVTLSTQLYWPLTEEEEATIMNALVKRINGRITAVVKSFGSNKGLISDEILEEIKKYRIISAYVGDIDPSKTNVNDYLDQVISLEVYRKYNDCWALMTSITEDCENANMYWDLAVDSYLDSIRREHLAKALRYYQKCLDKVNDYNWESFGNAEAYDMFRCYVDEISCYLNTGNDMYIDYSISQAFDEVMDEFTEKAQEFIDKAQALPTQVYYE